MNAIVLCFGANKYTLLQIWTFDSPADGQLVRPDGYQGVRHKIFTNRIRENHFGQLP